MSVNAIAWAFEQDLRPPEKLLLLALADCANQDALAWPSPESLVKKTSLSRATVYKYLIKLCDKNLIEKRATNEGWRRYKLNLSLRYSENLSSTQSVARNNESVARNTQSVARTPYIEEPSVEPSIEPTAVQQQSFTDKNVEPPTPEPPPFNAKDLPEGLDENFTSRLKGRPEPDTLKVFIEWYRITKPSRNYISPSDARMIGKALVERDLDTCLAAVRGIVIWARQKGDDKTNLGRAFTTYPGGKPLGEQIDFFAGLGKKYAHVPVDKNIPSADPHMLKTKWDELRRGYNSDPDSIPGRRAREAQKWLSEHGIRIKYREPDGYPVQDSTQP